MGYDSSRSAWTVVMYSGVCSIFYLKKRAVVIGNLCSTTFANENILLFQYCTRYF